MFQIGVVIKMTGLLLLTPSTAPSALPHHVLLPRASDHEASFAWRQANNAGCPHYLDDQDLCYFDLKEYDVTVESSAPSEPMPLNGSLGNVSKAVGVPVGSEFLGENPPAGKLNARVRLYAGRQTDHCPLARWFFNGNPWAPLGNVVTWEFTQPSRVDLVLTLRKLGDPGAPPVRRVVPRPASGHYELFIRHTPPEDDEMANERASFLTEARHFNHYYHMLGVDTAGQRPLPILLRKVRSRCPWTERPGDKATLHGVGASPGAPTCLVAGGTPAPPDRNRSVTRRP